MSKKFDDKKKQIKKEPQKPQQKKEAKKPVSSPKRSLLDEETDVEDDDITLTEALSWSSPSEPNFAGTGGLFTDALIVPGSHNWKLPLLTVTVMKLLQVLM